MKNILVVDPISTGQNFIEDITYRGYHPVALLMNADGDPESAEMIAESKKSITLPCDYIEEKKSYEETLELVKTFDPVIIVPGNEKGVILANQLAYDLGLKGNPIDRLDQMTKKNAMQDALKEAGMRYIKGKLVRNADEALQFCRENKLKMGVVKPIESAGSFGVTVCDDLEEVEHAVNMLIGHKDVYGRKIEKCLVQERIVGNEFIVNVAVSAGRMRLTSIFRYTKERTSEGGYIYNSVEVVERLEPGIQELIRYAFGTIKAIHFQYGTVHAEFMIDEKGPVLIEVNCRPVGCSMPPRYLDRCFGHHETDAVMDAYLDEEKFLADARKPYKTYCSAAIKLVMVPRRLEAESMPIRVIAENLRSTYKISVAKDGKPIQFPKTIDLETAGGAIYMAHEDHGILYGDLKLLEDIEKKYFSYLIDDGMNRRLIPFEDHMKSDPVKLIKETGCHGSILLVSDKKNVIENVLCITPQEAYFYGTGFDNVVIDLEQFLLDHKEAESLRLIFDLIKKTKRGGRVIIPENSYRYLSYGEQGAELILKVLGLEIQSEQPGEDNHAVIGRMN